MGCLQDFLLSAADSCLCLFLFFPLAIFHWRGTWQLQDVYFIPDNLTDSSWVSLAIGANLGLLELLVQPFLGNSLQNKGYPVLTFIATRLHLYVHGWAVMCFWRGLWNLMDFYLTEGWVNSVIIMVVCQVFAFITKTMRSHVGIPVSFMLDTDPELLQADTVFKVDHNKRLRFMLDCLFTQFIIISSSISIWRGIWNVLDTFLLPHRHLKSDLLSLLTGYACIGCLFLFQYPLSIISEKLENSGGKLCKIVYEDFIFLIATWGNLFLWRGAWDLCIEHVIPDPVIGSWTCHCIGTLGLMALQMFNNVGLNGIERDGQYPGGEGMFPIHYLRNWIGKNPKTSSKLPYELVSMEEENITDDKVAFLATYNGATQDDGVKRTPADNHDNELNGDLSNSTYKQLLNDSTQQLSNGKTSSGIVNSVEA